MDSTTINNTTTEPAAETNVVNNTAAETIQEDKKIETPKSKAIKVFLPVILIAIAIIAFVLYSNFKSYRYEDVTGIPRTQIAYEVMYQGDHATKGVKLEDLEGYGYNADRPIKLGKPAGVSTVTANPIHQKFYDKDGKLLFEDICYDKFSCIVIGKSVTYYY